MKVIYAPHGGMIDASMVIEGTSQQADHFEIDLMSIDQSAISDGALVDGQAIQLPDGSFAVLKNFSQCECST